MTFLFGSALTLATRKVVEGNNVRIAVAFWGVDGPNRIGLKTAKRTDWKVVCNLTMGGTNPSVIRNMENPGKGKTNRIRHSPSLHAKVFLGETSAIVGSNNVSANGLGLEGDEQAGWSEAGVLVTEPKELLRIEEWFEELWEDAMPVDKAALEKAERAHSRARGARAQSGRLKELEPDADDFPLIDWWQEAKYITHKDEIEREVGYFNQEVERQIHDGIELQHEDDLPHLFEGRWVLLWERPVNGKPDKARFSWTRLSGQVARNSYSYLGENVPKTAVLASSGDDRTPPFDLKSQASSIAQLLGTRKYSPLRTTRYQAWFAPRLELMRQFWRDLKAV